MAMTGTTNRWNIREVLAQLPKEEVLPPARQLAYDAPAPEAPVGRGLPEIAYHLSQLTYGEMIDLAAGLLTVKGDRELTERQLAQVLYEWSIQ